MFIQDDVSGHPVSVSTIANQVCFLKWNLLFCLMLVGV